MHTSADAHLHHNVAWEVTHRQNTSHCSREYLPSQLRCPKCNWHSQKTSPRTDINCAGPHHRYKCWPPQLRISLIHRSRTREFIESNKKSNESLKPTSTPHMKLHSTSAPHCPHSSVMRAAATCGRSERANVCLHPRAFSVCNCACVGMEWNGISWRSLSHIIGNYRLRVKKKSTHLFTVWTSECSCRASVAPAGWTSSGLRAPTQVDGHLGAR